VLGVGNMSVAAGISLLFCLEAELGVPPAWMQLMLWIFYFRNHHKILTAAFHVLQPPCLRTVGDRMALRMKYVFTPSYISEEILVCFLYYRDTAIKLA
jgi:hypothetical protein